MKKMLFILLAVLGLVSCRQDGDEFRYGGNQASTETKLVSLNLEGDLELPLEDLAQQGKALTLVIWKGISSSLLRILPSRARR